MHVADSASFRKHGSQPQSRVAHVAAGALRRVSSKHNAVARCGAPRVRRSAQSGESSHFVRGLTHTVRHGRTATAEHVTNASLPTRSVAQKGIGIAATHPSPDTGRRGSEEHGEVAPNAHRVSAGSHSRRVPKSTVLGKGFCDGKRSFERTARRPAAIWCGQPYATLVI